MFATGSSQNLWLIFLLVIWAALLFGGLVFGKQDERRGQRMPRWTRIASSLVLVVAAWSWMLFARETPAASYALLIAIGMTFGLLGDLFMANLIPVGQSVISGMAAFGIGHLFYIAAFLTLAQQPNLGRTEAFAGALVAWWMIGIVAWYLVLFRGQARTPLHWMALAYTLLLCATAAFASGLALQDLRFLPLAAGATLFLISDLILAVGMFTPRRFFLMDDVVWLTYGPAQALIVYSIDAALRVTMQ